MTNIVLQSISKRFPDYASGRAVLADISFEATSGSVVCVVGPNGCGKTTLLSIVAGLIEPTTGTIVIDGLAPGTLPFGFVFQKYRESLFPWRTVYQNLSFGLEVRHVPSDARRGQIYPLLRILGLFEKRSRYVYSLSGGEGQLVAIGRALAYDPDLLLLDEPLSALDVDNQDRLLDVLLSLFEERQLTTLCVTHDIDHAALLADEVVVLSRAPEASVVGVVEVGLRWPRHRDLMFSDSFRKITAEIGDLLRQGLRRSD